MAARTPASNPRSRSTHHALARTARAVGALGACHRARRSARRRPAPPANWAASTSSRAPTAACCRCTRRTAGAGSSARPGQEYGIRVCNTTGDRVLAVMSVDGVNVVSGETASPAQSGYVLSAHECADINGWRKNLASTAAFYFTELPDAYAARTGRPDNVGVIGVAFFRERPQRVAWKDTPARVAASPAAEPAARQDAAGGERRGRGPRASRRAGSAQRDGRRAAPAPAPMAKIGTGHGRQRVVVRADDALRARERDAERDRRDPLRPPREPHRDGHPAAALDRPLAQSVSRTGRRGSCRIRRRADLRPITGRSRRPLATAAHRLRSGRGPLAYWRAMPAPAIAAETRDEDLMLAYAAGDAAAFDALYARHKGGVYRYLLRHCGHAGVADELFQDVWMNVIRARASYVPSAKFTTWLYRIAHNRLIDHWRATGHVELVTAGPDDDADDPLDAIPAARERRARGPRRRARDRRSG